MAANTEIHDALHLTVHHNKISLRLVTVEFLSLLASPHLLVLFIALSVTLFTAQILRLLLTLCTCFVSAWRHSGFWGDRRPLADFLFHYSHRWLHAHARTYIQCVHVLRAWASLQIPAASVKDLTAGLYRRLAKKIPDLIIQLQTQNPKLSPVRPRNFRAAQCFDVSGLQLR